MSNELKISIVTPTYNSEEYLEKCILSIKGQSYTNFEHIIVDGGSTDGTLDIIKKYENTYPMKWISEPDEGMYDAINKGFLMASGDIYAWLNSDDFYFPWTFQVVSTVFENKKIEWLTGMPSNTKKYGTCEITYQLPNLPTVYCTPLIRKGVYDGRTMYFVQQESCFWSRKLWEQVGGLDKTYKLAGDYFLWRKFAHRARLFTVHCNLASFRIHDNQKSEDIETYFRETKRGRSKQIKKLLVLLYLQLYALASYNNYVINVNDIMSGGQDVK